MNLIRYNKIELIYLRWKDREWLVFSENKRTSGSEDALSHLRRWKNW